MIKITKIKLTKARKIKPSIIRREVDFYFALLHKN